MAILLLVFSLVGPVLRGFPYADLINGNLATIGLTIGLVVFWSVYKGWQPLKSITAAISGGADRGRLVINVGLSIVVILVVVALITSLYQTMDAKPGEKPDLWRDPEIIAVAIGLILSVLFVDRWRSLEGKVDRLASDQLSRLEEIQKTTLANIERQVGQTVDKAEKVSAKLASIAEQNPWLEVVTERDIIVETDSVRGILGSAYSLLNDSKTLHLYEYLDFCSRKGTPLDPRSPQTPLRGTADDFLEIAIFCEIWLGDYALSAEFLRRYLEQASSCAYTMYPDFVRRLMRIGDLPAARYHMNRLERIVNRRRFQKFFPFLDTPQPMSGRYYWYACNILALGHAAFGRDHLVERYLGQARSSPYAERFAQEQTLIDAERLVYQQQFKDALALLDREPEGIDPPFSALLDRIVLFERLGEFGRAAELRKRIDSARQTARGDVWSPGRGASEGEGATRPQAKARSRTAGSKRAHAKGASAEPDNKEQRSREAKTKTEDKGRGLA